MKELNREQQLEFNLIQIKIVQDLPTYHNYESMTHTDRNDLIDSTEKLAEAEFLNLYPELK